MNTDRWLVAILAAALLAGCRKEEPPAKDHDHDHDHAHEHAEGEHADEVTLGEEAVKRNGIREEPTAKRVLVPRFAAPGRVAFNDEAVAHVGSPLTGRVRELPVKKGDVVAKGDVLLVLESAEYGGAQVEYLEKLTAASVAAPAVDLARGAHERGKALHEGTRGISLSELERRELEWRTAAGALETAKAAVAAAENRLLLLGMTKEGIAALARTREVRPEFAIRAPLAGEILEREVTLGELARPDRDALLVIADLSVLRVWAEVPEARLGDVAVGAAAAVEVPAFPDRRFEGRVALVAPEVDAATRTARVRIDIAREGAALRPGMFARVVLDAVPPGGAPAPAVLSIPEEALQTVEGGPAVFVPVPGEPNTWAKRSVAVGPAVGGRYPVLSGLKEGEPVVVAGSFLLKAELGKAGAAHEH